MTKKYDSCVPAGDHLPLDYDLDGQWGLRWAALAARDGRARASAEPLPADQESTAAEFAQDLLADVAEGEPWVREVARHSAWLAVDAYRAYRDRASKLRAAKDDAELFIRTATAFAETNSTGRLAALWNRVRFLVSRELDRPQ